MLLEGPLVGCGPNRGYGGDDQETRPIAHVDWVTVGSKEDCRIGYLCDIRWPA